MFRKASASAAERLRELADRSTRIMEDGFCIDLSRETATWDALLKAVGIKAGYRLLAEHLCRRYREKFGREFLFSDSCVAYEIEYHTDAYMCAVGYHGYIRNVTSWLFTKRQLISHCEKIDICTKDTADFRQRNMFRYKAGIRKCYRGTEHDPFRR